MDSQELARLIALELRRIEAEERREEEDAWQARRVQGDCEGEKGVIH